MNYISIIGIAVGLAMDAFAAAITAGAVTKKVKFAYFFKVAFLFGFFQFFMPVLGLLIGVAGQNLISKIDHFIAFGLLSYIGFNMIYESKHKKEAYKNYESLKSLLILAFATSIDALATGIILPSILKNCEFAGISLSVLLIGIITFIISFLGVYIGTKFGMLLLTKAEIFGGIVLIVIGIKTLIEHIYHL